MLARGRWHRPPPSRRGTRVVAVASTGGELGQSTMAAHLAMAMANLGAQVIAVDLDQQAPTLSRWLGTESARLGWHALVDREIATLDLALTRSPVRNLQVLSAGTSRAGRAPGNAGDGLDGEQRGLLLQQLRGLGADVVILDLARVSHQQLAAWLADTEVGLLVTTPSRPSLAAALELISDLGQRTLPDVGDSDRNSAEVGMPLLGPGTRLVGNRADTPEDVEILHAFSRLVRTDMSIDLPVLGCVFTQDRLAAAAAPAHTAPGQISFDPNSQTFLRMGEILLHEDLGVSADATDSGAIAAGAISTISARGAAVPTPPPAGEADPDSGPTSVAAWPTPLSGDPQRILAAQLDRHRRKQVRFDVDWMATLNVGIRALAVRVVDVSQSGAALEIVSPLPLGTTGTLVFDQLARQPAVPIVVKSLRPEVGRAGVGFVGAEDVRQALVAAAQEQQAPVPNDQNDEEPTRPLRVPSGA
jgi:MinD-like ATPase involved in chromosome partitioning or flagellar assembly